MHTNLMRWVAAALLVLATGLPSQTALPLSPELAQALSSNRGIEALFAPIAQRAARSVLEITSEGPRGEAGEDRPVRYRILGTVVASDGWILTKASEVGTSPRVHLPSDRGEVEARVVKTDEQHDVALLKIDVKDLHAVTFVDVGDLKPGQWLVTPGVGDEPAVVGVVAVPPRRIGRGNAFLGVQLEDQTGGGALVTQVLEDTSAERAGLEVKDIVTEINGQKVTDRADLIARIALHDAGTRIRLTLRRGTEEITKEATLGRRDDSAAPVAPSSRRRPGRRGRGFFGASSRRSDGFLRAVQHDGVVMPDACGGPVLDAEGRVVALNIARQSRTSTLAIMARDLAEMLEATKSTNDVGDGK